MGVNANLNKATRRVIEKEKRERDNCSNQYNHHDNLINPSKLSRLKKATIQFKEGISKSSTTNTTITKETEKTKFPVSTERSSKKLRDGYRSSCSSAATVDKDDDVFNYEGGLESEDDPLIGLIESHNTQRVRFNLSRNEVKDERGIGGVASSASSSNPSLSAASVKGFMMRILFGSGSGNGNGGGNNKNLQAEEGEFSKDLKAQNLKSCSCPDLLDAEDGHEFINNGIAGSTEKKKDATYPLYISASEGVILEEDDCFEEDEEKSAKIRKILSKGKRAQYSTFKYEKAIHYYLQAMSLLDKHSYPHSHKLKSRTLKQLHDTHHAKSSLENSANIVKMGLRHEDKNEFIKALKMYTIAYRIRKDALGKRHPSLPVLLNMLGSVQVKRGELKEAMQIFELALNGRLDDFHIVGKRNITPETKIVTLREMGMIRECWGEDDLALEMYHDSLECIVRAAAQHCSDDDDMEYGENAEINLEGGEGSLLSQSVNLTDEIRLIHSSPPPKQHDCSGMEVYLEIKDFDTSLTTLDIRSNPMGVYNSFFQKKLLITNKESTKINVAMTLHRIANLHRKKKDFEAALSAYYASYRGMKMVLGKSHPNVAAVLGSIGNVHKEMNNYDEAYSIYQEVLGIESLRLGFEHPEIIVTLHNIAMIETCRGNYDAAISLFHEVLNLQRVSFGLEDNAVAVTSSCLGDVHVKNGNIAAAIHAYKETLWIRSSLLDRLHPDIGKLYHKIGVLHAKRDEVVDADTCITKAIRIYKYNKIDDYRMVEARRDKADMRAKIVLSPQSNQKFEI